MEFLYDHTGVFAVKYNDAVYVYRKDAQENIVELLDNTGATMVKYRYDAWGNCQTTVIDSTATEIATLNPFRYRSYYYDTETGFYFLKTRYYDPEIGRFMTIDDLSYLDPETVNGLNLYAYCANNPVNRIDQSGTFALTTILLLIGIGVAIGGALGGYTAYSNDQNVLEGILVGALLGGAVGAIIGVGGVALSGAISSLFGKAISDVINISLYGGEIGTWEDYAVAFIFGGIAGELGKVISTGGSVASVLAQGGKFFNDVLLRPAASQAVKMVTRGTTFNSQKLAYDAFSRTTTYYGTNLIIKGEFMGQGLKIDLGKIFGRVSLRYFSPVQ